MTKVGTGTVGDSSRPAHPNPYWDDFVSYITHANAAREPGLPCWRPSGKRSTTVLTDAVAPGAPDTLPDLFDAVGRQFTRLRQSVQRAALQSNLRLDMIDAILLWLLSTIELYSMAAAKMVSTVIPALERLVLALLAGRPIDKSLPTRGGRVALKMLVSCSCRRACVHEASTSKASWCCVRMSGSTMQQTAVYLYVQQCCWQTAVSLCAGGVAEDDQGPARPDPRSCCH